MNNLCEYFNSYIIKAREKPIIIILEMIKKKLMKRYQKKRQGIREYIGDWCSKILAKLELCGKDAGECTSYYAREGLFEVECSYMVSLRLTWRIVVVGVGSRTWLAFYAHMPSKPYYIIP
jgi:hypothetical protein